MYQQSAAAFSVVLLLSFQFYCSLTQTVNLKCGNDEICANTTTVKMITCIVNDPDDSNMLVWNLFNESTNTTIQYDNSSNIDEIEKFEVNSSNPLSVVLINNTDNMFVSQILFLPIQMVDGIQIQCGHNMSSFEMMSCTINISDIPSAPLNITHTIYNFNSSVKLSWSPPTVSNQCIQSYIICINTTCNLTTSDTTIMIPIPKDIQMEVYCATVAATDFASRTGETSERVCVTFSGTSITTSLTTTTVAETSTTTSSIRTTTTTQSKTVSTSKTTTGTAISSSSTMSTTTSSHLTTIDTQSSSLSMTKMMVSSSSVSSSKTLTPSSSSSSEGTQWPIIGGAAGGTVFVVIIIVILVIVSIYCVVTKGRSKEYAITTLEQQAYKPAQPENIYREVTQSTSAIPMSEMMSPSNTVEAQPLYDDTVTRVRPTIEAVVPTYQDPGSIRRETSSTGAIYTIPQKTTGAASTNNKPTTGGANYAELSFSNSNSEHINDSQRLPEVTYAQIQASS